MTYRSAEEFICIFCLVFPPLCLSVAQWSSEDKVLKGLQALHSSCLVVQKICHSTPLVEMQLSPLSDMWRAFWGEARGGGVIMLCYVSWIASNVLLHGCVHVAAKHKHWTHIITVDCFDESKGEFSEMYLKSHSNLICFRGETEFLCSPG